MTSAELHSYVVAQWQRMLDTARRAQPWPDVGVVVEGTEQGAAFVASEMTVAHIAAFDPTFATAVCEAALERLSRHKPVQLTWGSICEACAGHPDGEPWRLSPCPELLADARPFATRPDFPEELAANG